MTVLHPTAGYILDVAHGATPGPLSAAERDQLRALARRVAEIAADPQQAVKRDLWVRHNRLEKVRPLVLMFPEDSWAEIIGEDQLALTDPFWRQQEWYLKHLIYRAAHLPDDFVVEPNPYVTRVVQWGDYGLRPVYHRTDQRQGSYVWDAPLQDPSADIQKLHYPQVGVDEASTQRAYQALGDVLGDILPVRIHCPVPYANLIGEATALRGIEQVMLDMLERPAWLHELMGFLAEGFMRGVRYLEENDYLTLNNANHYNDSGGIGYSHELPSPQYDGQHVRLRDVWGFGVAQELAGVGPRQHEEFVLAYQLRLLEHTGLNAYGCCEAYTAKFDMLKRRVPRLRRVSVSPWCDLEVAAAQLEDQVILSWKPNPALVAPTFDAQAVRDDIRRALEVTRGCVVEMIHKDTFTICQEPARLETWTRIAREEIERVA